MTTNFRPSTWEFISHKEVRFFTTYVLNNCCIDYMRNEWICMQPTPSPRPLPSIGMMGEVGAVLYYSALRIDFRQ